VPPDITLTAGGVISALAIIVGVLWRDHLRADAEDRAQRDKATERLDKLDASLNRLATGVEKLGVIRQTENRGDHRRSD
jgi:hypothetical protein